MMIEEVHTTRSRVPLFGWQLHNNWRIIDRLRKKGESLYCSRDTLFVLIRHATILFLQLSNSSNTTINTDLLTIKTCHLT